ncbi:MAG TPA: metallophosphoesterase [Candidatus Acidoferrum sp.]|jgi:hypothetical protein|nr:metallophosphoesterase [Candidatus Acidoferrum sp.]
MNGRLIFLLMGALAAAPAPADEFEFVVIGDTRPRFESEDFRLFEGLIPEINALKPAFVINLGDLIYGYGPRSKEKQWDKYERVIKAIEAPYYQAPGNHDTHSKEARRIYTRRFGKCYQSFDFGGCHFVLLDNTEAQRGGYIGAVELAWLQDDLKGTKERPTFVFFHFPVWEPERVAPKYYEFWAQTLHPLFKESCVRAVFAGHYHTYGPSREFDGIRYFITGGGGAELIPDYKKSGGVHHFVVVRVNGDQWDLRVVTERGELTDADADVMGGLQFGDQHSSRIGFEPGAQELTKGAEFSVSLRNPYPDFLAGKASWVFDPSAFAVQPAGASVQIPPGGTHQYSFTVQALKDAATLQSLPRLEFNVVAGQRRHRFHRELLVVQKAATRYRRRAPTLDGQLGDWEGVPSLILSNRSSAEAQLRAFNTDETLYLAVTIPTVKAAEEDESAVIDDLQIGIARRLDDTGFSGDFLRLGFSGGIRGARNASPGRNAKARVPGVSSASGVEGDRTNYEIAIPLRLLKHVRPGADGGLVLNLSFRAPDGPGTQPPEPQANTFAYRVRYGGDALLPVYFVELNLEKRAGRAGF